jgi:hypothetical protein
MLRQKRLKVRSENLRLAAAKRGTQRPDPSAMGAGAKPSSDRLEGNRLT